MTQRRQLVLHIGTHKTGTTAIQLALEEERLRLAECGVLVPRAGVLDACGHHAVAEALIHGESDSIAPELAGVLSELEASPLPRAILSSENFSLLFAFPERLATLALDFAAIRYDVIVVVYVRDQVALAESLYAELLKHGLTWSFETFLEMLLERAQIDATDRLHFPFDYSLLASRFETAFGKGRVEVRAHRPGAELGELLDSFWRALGATRSGPQSRARRNERFTMLETLEALHRTIAGRDPSAADPRAIAREAGIDPSELERPGALLRPEEAERIRARFAQTNRDLARTYGVAIEYERDRFPASEAGRRIFRTAMDRWKL